MSQLMRYRSFNVLLVFNTLEKWAKSSSVIVISYNSSISSEAFTDRVSQKTLTSLWSWEDKKFMIFNGVLVVSISDNVNTQTSSKGVWYVASYQTAHVLRVSIITQALSGDVGKRKILHPLLLVVLFSIELRLLYIQEWVNRDE